MRDSFTRVFSMVPCDPLTTLHTKVHRHRYRKREGLSYEVSMLANLSGMEGYDYQRGKSKQIIPPNVGLGDLPREKPQSNE